MKPSKRVVIVVALLSVFSLSCVCCVGVAVVVSVFNREKTRKQIDEANALWDRGEKAGAVADYKSVYKQALVAEKEKFLPRIVEFEAAAGNLDEAKTWIKRGLDDKLNAEYTDPAAKELFVAAKKERDEAIAREAEEKRKKQEAAKAEAERKTEEEYNANGLVLLKKTVQGAYDRFGFTITGTVVNRRARKLRYAQITFNVYDESGVQVGSALANINGLEPGGGGTLRP